MITKMKKILLAGKIEDREKVLTVLRAAETVHVDAAVPEKIKIPEALDSEYEECGQAISILSQLSAKSDVDCLATPGTPTRLVEETLSHNKALSELKNRVNAVSRELEETKKWGSIGLKDIETLAASGVNTQFLKGSAKNIGDIEAECACHALTIDSADIIVAFSRNEIKFPESFTPISAPKREVLQINEELQSVNKSIADNEHALLCIKERLSELQEHLVKLGNKRRFKEVETGVFCEDKLFVLTGWCPEDKTQELQKKFDESGVAVGMDFIEPEEGDRPPTKLDNNSYASSASPLLKLMGMTPSYNEPDTSFWFISTLIIFASFIVADFGYGLLMALPLIIGYKSFVKKGVDANLLKLLIFLSTGTAIYGIITNSFFGFAPFKFGFAPGEADMVLWQKLCLFIGALHLSLAHAMKMMRMPKDIKLVGEAGWFIFLWAMYGLLCSLITGEDYVFPLSAKVGGQILYVLMFEISLVMILFFTEPSTNPVKMIMAGLGSIASNASGMFSDILSYIRLWAVGLAGGKVAGAFNDIGSMAADKLGFVGIVIMVVVFLFGHALNIILSIISVLAHGVRLNLLEFTNHLGLEWAGREYDPFKEK